ncbi:MAG: biotin--[acetyl-CoA-carboxylase] ligase [Thermoplasmata archaeon]
MAGRIVRRSVVDSTNDEAKALIAEGAAPWTVVVAEKQVAGKGRFGRSWASPRGGLYLSVVLPQELEKLPLLSMAASLAVAEVLDAWGLSVAVKWPNDVQVGNAKVAGILVEGLVRPGGYWAVVGIGVNSDVPTEKLRGRLDNPVTTLRHELGDRVDNEELRTRLLKAFRAYAERLGDPSSIIEAYQDRCVTLGRNVVIETLTGVVQGKAVAVRGSGALVVRQSDGKEREVTDGTVRESSI